MTCIDIRVVVHHWLLWPQPRNRRTASCGQPFAEVAKNCGLRRTIGAWRRILDIRAGASSPIPLGDEAPRGSQVRFLSDYQESGFEQLYEPVRPTTPRCRAAACNRARLITSASAAEMLCRQ